VRTIKPQSDVQQHGGWYTGHWWVGCYIWYSEEGPGRAAGHAQFPPRCTKCNINGQYTYFILLVVAL